jgi:hypothetical protein
MSVSEEYNASIFRVKKDKQRGGRGNVWQTTGYRLPEDGFFIFTAMRTSDLTKISSSHCISSNKTP